MEVLITKKQGAFFFAIFISLTALTVFLYKTDILLKPLVLIMISIFVIAPFSKDSPFAKRMLFLITILFIGWLLSDLGFALIPFAVAFLLAYLLDPFVGNLEKINIPRWLSALLLDLILVGGVAGVAVFVFPVIYQQLDDAISRISLFISDISRDLESKSFYTFMKGFGLKEETTRSIVHTDVIPKLKVMLPAILESLLKLITNLSALATQVINMILVPILFFYFLKDYRKIVTFLKRILKEKNRKLLNDLRRISKILKKYISWQIASAIIVASVCSFFFSIFDIPYPIILGIMCGILNPIPYLGIFASLIICVFTVSIISPSDLAVSQIIIISIVIGTMHFINAYLLEPNIVGKMVGLHPVLLIASLFVFGGMFGFLGLLIAVPLTATLMMFFNDWVKKNVENAGIKPPETNIVI